MKNPFERGPEYEPREKTCPKCEGRGRVRVTDDKGNTKDITCDRCGGSGVVLSRR